MPFSADIESRNKRLRFNAMQRRIWGPDPSGSPATIRLDERLLMMGGDMAQRHEKLGGCFLVIATFVATFHSSWTKQQAEEAIQKGRDHAKLRQELGIK